MAKVSPERPQGVRGEKMPIDGILVVDKPSGVTSHDIVDLIRGRFGFKKVGHAGTLDPLATGVLVILIGRATKLSNELLNREKEYEVSMVLGKRTDTGDADGKTIFEGKDYTGVTAAVMTAAMKKFTGSILQTPPMTSAVRHQGQKLYELARKGIEVERVARPVEIHELSLLSFAPPQVVLRAKCSKGTYVRVLCDDLGLELGCGAYVSGIKRIRSGDFSIVDAVNLAAIRSMKRAEVAQLLKNENYYRYTSVSRPR